MYLVDYHVHTSRCGHASGEDHEYVESAIAQGLREIGFADHIPRYYDAPDSNVVERGMHCKDLETYVSTVLHLREQYPEITIRLGLEVDYLPGAEEQLRALLAPFPWDYLLGAVHFIPEWDFGYIGYDQVHQPAEIYQKYFDFVARAAESGLFDSLAHIDLPRRFFPRLEEDRMQDLFASFAHRLGQTPVVIELNTYGIRSARQKNVGIFPDPSLLRLCHSHGIRVTCGSDAHRPQDVAAGFDAVRDLLSQTRYNKITIFDHRHPTSVLWR